MQFSISCTGTCLKTVYHTVMKLNLNWHVVNPLLKYKRQWKNGC